MIRRYIQQRFNPLKYVALSALLCCLVPIGWNSFLLAVLSLFLALFVFRLLDDYGARQTDRVVHKARTYLQPPLFKGFQRLTFLSITLGVVTLGLYSIQYAFIVFGLVLVCGILYHFLSTDRLAVSLIGLIKYPVLMYLLQREFAPEADASALFASFLLLVSYDVLELLQKHKIRLWPSLLFVFLTSWVAVDLQFNMYWLLGLLLLATFIAWKSRKKYTKYIAIAVIPILSLITYLYFL